MDIDAGSLVYSLAGRDKGGLFLVLNKTGDYCFVADGRGRKSDKPKKKKLKHTRLAGTASEEICEKLSSGLTPTNAEIRRSLRCFTENGEAQGYEEVQNLG